VVRASIVRTMNYTTAQQLAFLGTAACAPIALGIAMHLEHVEATRACMAELAEPATAEAAPVVVAVPTPVPTPGLVEPAAAPIDDVRGAYDFAFVADMPTPHIVLASETDLGEAAFEALATGAPHYRGEPADGQVDQPVFRGLDIERLPERARFAMGRHVRVYSAAGRVCIARIGRPALVSELWGTIEYFSDDDISEIEQGDRTIVDPASIWDDGRRLVVAPLEGEGCGDALWARDAALSEALVYVAQDVDGPEDLPSPVARRMVQRSSELRPISAKFAEHVAGMSDEPFTTRRLVDRLEGRRWIDPLRGGELDVFTTDGEEFGGCGGFDPAWAAIAIDGEGSPVEPVWADATTDAIDAVFDLDADGVPEVMAQTWLGTTRVYSLGEDLGEVATLGAVPFFGCPC
jgi:hypothetical protein